MLSPDHQDRSFTAFKKYIDAILDLLLGDKYITDHYGQEEILFMGPDEGTADMMNWASQHSRERGYKVRYPKFPKILYFNEYVSLNQSVSFFFIEKYYQFYRGISPIYRDLPLHPPKTLYHFNRNIPSFLTRLPVTSIENSHPFLPYLVIFTETLVTFYRDT